jgi:hypothetical protein
VAPASRYSDGSGSYQWEGEGLDGLGNLPEFPFERLPSRRLRDGSRKQGLNDYLCSQAAYCDTFDELLDVARTWNDDLPDPLADSTVVQRARKAWKDYEDGRLEAWVGGPGVAKSRMSDVRALGGNGDALMLLVVLKIMHGARCARGETFNITPVSMLRDQVIPGWSQHRYERARDVLLAAGFIVKVADFKLTANGRVGAQYTLLRSMSKRVRAHAGLSGRQGAPSGGLF